MHSGFDFWIEGSGAEPTADVDASLERANASVVPTARLTGVDAAYWCRIGTKEHLRWVLPHDEEPLLDALARLHARGEDTLGEGTRLIGTFRAARPARAGLGPRARGRRPTTSRPRPRRSRTGSRWRSAATADARPSPSGAPAPGLSNRQVTLR